MPVIARYSWIAATLLTLLPGFGTLGAQAGAVSPAKLQAPHGDAVTVQFTFQVPGSGFLGRGDKPGFGAGPKRNLPSGKGGGSGMLGQLPLGGLGPLTGGGEGGRGSGRTGGRRGGGGGPGGILGAAGVAGLATAFVIAGAGGADRPPVAPRYVGAPGQSPNQVAAALLEGKRHRPKELLLEVSIGTAGDLMQNLAREYNAEIVEVGVIELAQVRIRHLTVKRPRDLLPTLVRLLEDRRVLTAQPNYIYTPVQGAPAAERPAQDAAAKPGAQAPQPDGRGIKLAIIDTCLEASHTELQGSVAAVFDATQAAPAEVKSGHHDAATVSSAIAGTFDAAQAESGGCKPENHGTAVASVIAGHGKLHGPAEGASLLAAKAFSYSAEAREDEASSREIALSMDWAVKSGAQIMNMSFTGPADPLIERAVAAAYRKGVGLVAAAGNAGPSSPPLYPAAYPEVIAVTATNGKRQIYAAANRGKYISVSARGVDVLAAHINNTYGVETGTSFAAAEVSGIVAELLEKRPGAGPEEIRKALQGTAAAVPGADKETAGFGQVNPPAALAFVENALPQEAAAGSGPR